MADIKKSGPEPQGFGEHTRKASSENAHQQGWGLNEDERANLAAQKTGQSGGTDYEYGARDFGDEAVDTRSAKVPSPTHAKPPAREPASKNRKAG